MTTLSSAAGAQEVPSTDPRASLSVVICAYTTRRTEQMLESARAVAEQLRTGDELLMVIDHNPELEQIAAAAVPALATAGEIRVCSSRGKPGLSGARNTGIEAARGDVIAFVDDDATVLGDWAEHLMGHFEDQTVAGVGGYAEPEWPGPAPQWFPPEFYWVVGCSHVGLPTAVTEVRNFIGANMAFRRDVFARVGGFDATVGRVGSVPVGCEETELCIRYRRAEPGHRLLFDPDVRVRHFVSADRVTWRYFRMRCLGEGSSKRRVAQLVGADDALSSERSYVATVLPRAVLRGLRQAASPQPARSRVDALRRSGVVVVGLALTGYGYLRAMVPDRGRAGDR